MASSLAATDEAGLLWLESLQRALGRASHDVKDALNGVSVNLEVIRSRAARVDAPASAVLSFAESAAQQVERLTRLIEAVLALGRPARDPADIGVSLRRIVVVCGASSSNLDAAVELRELEAAHRTGTLTSVRGDIVRLALLAPLLEIVAGHEGAPRASAVECVLGGDAVNVLVTIGASGRHVSMPPSVAEVVRSGGVSIMDGRQDLSLAFPRA